MIDGYQTIAGLRTEGFVKVHETTKVFQFRRGNETVYVKAVGTSLPLVIGGWHAGRIASLVMLPGVLRHKSSADPYHNANMRAFGERVNRGKKPTRFGYDFGFEDEPALAQFLRAL